MAAGERRGAPRPNSTRKSSTVRSASSGSAASGSAVAGTSSACFSATDPRRARRPDLGAPPGSRRRRRRPRVPAASARCTVGSSALSAWPPARRSAPGLRSRRARRPGQRVVGRERTARCGRGDRVSALPARAASGASDDAGRTRSGAGDGGDRARATVTDRPCVVPAPRAARRGSRAGRRWRPRAPPCRRPP